MSPTTAWRTNSNPTPWMGFLETVTSGNTLITTVSNRIEGVVMLVTTGFTNAMSLLVTPETLHLRANSAMQITSCNATLLLGESLEETIPDSPNADAIHELRLLTGFTWDQIARLFSVSRRSIHLWASGGPMSRENEEHLHRVLGIIRQSDSGRAGNNRAALLSHGGPSSDCAFDLLIARDYEHAALLLGNSDNASQWHVSHFSPSSLVLSERAPRPPEVLVAARQDDGPMAPRRARSVRYRKVERES